MCSVPVTLSFASGGDPRQVAHSVAVCSIGKYFRALGCSVKTGIRKRKGEEESAEQAGVPVNTAILVIPLKFPIRRR